jgi:CRISPR/Cas system CSM-associated protein Csm3 (group 7 of RAMP superfamily)
MRILHVELTTTSELHIGGNKQGSVLDFLKLRTGEPYIPATHVKGIMRSEAERILRVTQNIPCSITGMAEGRDHGIHLCRELEEEGKYFCCICKLFGSPNRRGGESCREGKIRVMNFYLKHTGTSGSGQRTHVSIDRDTGCKRTGALYTTLTVPKGAVFSGDIIIRETLGKPEEENLLFGCIHAMADYGIGGERSRGLGQMLCTVTEEKQSVDFKGGAL